MATENEPSSKRTFAPTQPASLVLLNTGDGKGKSTAAFGVVLRALAQGWPVCVIQFLKSSGWTTGEEQICERLGVTWIKGGDGFTWASSDPDESRACARAAWSLAADLLALGPYRLLVLDELTLPLAFGWLETERVVGAIRSRQDGVNVVITGRGAPPELVEVADVVTEMIKVRHPFDAGVVARAGIDF
jgi:cob(I)alamin adenosyltransferase